MIDLAIVGGGPAGLIAATRLAETGLDVHLFEEHPEIGAPTHCTGIVSLEAAEFAKIPDDVVLNQLHRAAFVVPGAERCTVEWPDAADRILVIDRGGFDRALAHQAVGAGVTIRTAARVHEVATGREGVDVSLASERVRARACVLASGVSYRFQRQLGLGLPGQVIHTAQVEVDAEPSATVEIHLGQTLAPEGFAWTVPVNRDGRSAMKIGVMAQGDAGRYLGRFLARPDIRERLRTEPEEPIRRLLPLRTIRRTYANRLLVVGDAGGFTKATTGGGIFYSLLTGTLAAETFVDAFRTGRLDESALRVYERAWRRMLAREFWTTQHLRRMVQRSTDEEIRLLLRAFAAANLQGLVEKSVRFNWHRALILTLLTQPAIAPLVLRSYFR